MSLEEQSTLLFDIYFQEEKMFHLFLVCAFPFKVHLIAIFSLWAFFFFPRTNQTISSYQGAQDVWAVKSVFSVVH